MIIFLTNNKDTYKLADWLKNICKENVKVLVKRIETKDILYYKPDWVISYGYKYIIKEDVISLIPGKIINLHISYLPWNKGADPNIWSFLENTPKGVTIHFIDKGLDTGKIILQKKININENNETLRSSYDLLHKEIQTLFQDNWEKIKKSNIRPKKQRIGGSFHKRVQFEQIKSILGAEGWNIPIKELKKRYKLL